MQQQQAAQVVAPQAGKLCALLEVAADQLTARPAAHNTHALWHAKQITPESMGWFSASAGAGSSP